MAQDYIVRLQGQDNLSSTIKNVKDELKSTSESATQLDKIQKQFEKISTSSAPLKRQLRDLQAIMAQMNMNGLTNTAQFTEIAQYAGSVKDALGDAQQAISKYSSDTSTLDAVASGFQGISGAITFATGAMSLFGVENENVQQAILKVQSAMALLNGLQSIANTLNKDSALVLKLKVLLKTTAAQTESTTATAANNAATAESTTATVASTTATVESTTATVANTQSIASNTVAQTASATSTVESTTATVANSAATVANTQTTAANTVVENANTVAEKINTTSTAANTVVENANSVAATANTVAEKINTRAIITNTAAQKAWNVAKAIGKALFGDVTGLILVGVGALAAYAIATNDATKEQKEMNDALDKTSDTQKNYQKVMADTYASLMTSYTQLKNGWNSLKTVHEKNKWITENKNKLQELEISVNNVEDAERVFNGNTNAVVDSFIKRAKAAARLAELTDLYRKQMELLDKRNETMATISANSAKNRTGHTAVAGQEIPIGNYDSKYGSINAQGKWVFSEQGARNWNNGLGENSQTVKNIDEQIDKNNQQINKIATMIAEDVKNRPSSNNTKTVNSTTKPNNHSTTIEEVKFAQGSLDDLENQLSEAKKRLTSGLFQTGETQQSITKLIDDLQKKVDSKKIELGLELSDEAKRTLEIQKENANKLEKANEEFNNLNTTYKPETSSFDNAIKQNEQANGYVLTNQGRLDEIQKEMDFNDDLIKQLQELKAIYDALGDVEGLKKVNDQLATINTTQQGLSSQAKELNQKKIDWEQQQTAMQGVSDVAGSMGNAFSSLGQVFSAVGDESAAAVMQMVTTTLDGVAQIIPQIMALIGAKQGEAMALGTASAAALPFPANLAAIASITATIISTFAGIIAATQKFADGGIVGGSSYYGDKIVARLNSGEMVLNRRQQANLFKAIDNGMLDNVTNGSPTTISFKLKGSDIYGSLKNFTHIKSKSSSIKVI